MIRSKPLTIMLVFLSVVTVITMLLQISRSDFFLISKRDAADLVRPSRLTKENALPEDRLKALDQERYLILYNPNEEFSRKIKVNAETLLAGMKKGVRSQSVSEPLDSDYKPAAIIVTVQSYSSIADMDALIRYVEQGGRVMLAAVPEVDNGFYRLYRKLGILDSGSYVDAQSIRFRRNILIGYGDAEFNGESLQNSLLSVKLDERAEVLAETDEGSPLIWQTAYGDGEFLVFNGTMLQDKISRGLIAGCLGTLLPDFIYPIYNSKSVYIDDFPAPPPSLLNDKIYGQYQMGVGQYYSQIWWPDMIRFAKRHHLRYTALLIVNYGDRVKPPFDWREDSDAENFARYSKEILKQGGEIGVHGYNHQSLTTDKRIADAYGYLRWPDEDAMAASLRAVLEFERSVLPNYKLRTYVPPSNAMDSSARSVLKRELPDLTNISSLFLEDAERITYGQEYGIGEDGVVDLPRVTSGFSPDIYEQWSAANIVTAYGSFSHFVHPDDSYDPERSYGLTWEQLSKRFEEFLADIDKRYPWLTPTTASEASNAVERLSISSPVIVREHDGLSGYINSFTGPQEFILRTDKKIAEASGCQWSNIDSGVYLIKAQRPVFKVKWRETE
ncbi:membrane protein [Cohnella xylanilytica]|uniref:DUF2194 domain-containing protein n=1 Tax=Cohnella xylanilytica TaxID=557555 RepID=A0A841TX04_9BACL|nr:DUF2194 domain-containing protein [Cohnella xylanilytica]MBB6691528.1 DUF2194 domain-containing protein [Cohnella xylanilytica]GIO12907.1 membrane protein [Cohnella xylanilytica]